MSRLMGWAKAVLGNPGGRVNRRPQASSDTGGVSRKDGEGFVEEVCQNPGNFYVLTKSFLYSKSQQPNYLRAVKNCISPRLMECKRANFHVAKERIE